MLASLNDVVLVTEAEPVDPPGPRIVYVNDAFERVTGYAASEVIGQTPRMLQGPRSSRAELARLRAALGTWASCRICVTNYRKDGTPFDVEFEVVPVANDDGWYTHWVAIQRDVTERTLAVAVIEAAATVEDLFQHAGAELAEYTGADGCTVCARGSADEAWYVQHVRFEAGSAVMHQIIPPAAVSAAVHSLVSVRHAVSEDHPLVREQQGTLVRGEYHARPGGGAVAMLVWRAGTGAWPLADALLPQLVKRVGDKYDGLVVQRERARLHGELIRAQKLEAVGRLAGGVAHDFNNLLTVITGNLEFLREQLQGQLTEEPAELNEVLQAVARAGGLVAQLMSISHRRSSAHDAVDLGSLVTSTAALLRRTLGANVDVITDVSSEALVIDGDAMLLEQALLNLALNARDAIESVDAQPGIPAYGTITIAARAMHLTATEARYWVPLQPGRCIELTVRDTGPGMTAQAQTHAFEPFFTTKDVGAGTGLGLSSVLGTVTNLAGVVHLEAAVPHGVVVRMRFPWGTIPVPHVSDERTAIHATMPRRLLVVEDEVGVRRVIVRMLESAGYRVIEASDGAEALAVIAVHHEEVDAVVTDVSMPVMDGITMARELRRSRPDLPLLFISGNAEAGILDEFGAGVSMLSKPFPSARLLTTINAMLSTQRLATAPV
jgi:PAS domain S-box-containing protein